MLALANCKNENFVFDDFDHIFNNSKYGFGVYTNISRLNQRISVVTDTALVAILHLSVSDRSGSGGPGFESRWSIFCRLSERTVFLL